MKSVSQLQFDHNWKQSTNTNKVVLYEIPLYNKRLVICPLNCKEALVRQPDRLPSYYSKDVLTNEPKLWRSGAAMFLLRIRTDLIDRQTDSSSIIERILAKQEKIGKFSSCPFLTFSLVHLAPHNLGCAFRARIFSNYSYLSMLLRL